MNAEITRGGFRMTHARIEDHGEVHKLLASLPDWITQKARQLAEPTMRGRSEMHYDNELKRAYFLVHGTEGVLCCVTFDGVWSLGEAALLWGEFRRESECVASRFAAHYAKVAGLTLAEPE